MKSAPSGVQLCFFFCRQYLSCRTPSQSSVTYLCRTTILPILSLHVQHRVWTAYFSLALFSVGWSFFLACICSSIFLPGFEDVHYGTEIWYRAKMFWSLFFQEDIQSLNHKAKALGHSLNSFLQKLVPSNQGPQTFKIWLLSTIQTFSPL